MGIGHDWDIWYNGMIIGNCKAMKKAGATKTCQGNV